MHTLDFEIVAKILICFAIMFMLIRHYFDSYCQRRFNYDFLNKTGVGFILLFLGFNLLVHFMLNGMLSKASLAVIDALVLLGSFLAIFIFNIQKTNLWVGTVGTLLQFTLLISVVLFIALISMGWQLFLIFSSTHYHNDD